MITKKSATDKDNFFFEDSAPRGNVHSIFCGIHTFKFIDRSSPVGKDLTPPFSGGGWKRWPEGNWSRLGAGDPGTIRKIAECGAAKKKIWGSLRHRSVRERPGRSIRVPPSGTKYIPRRGFEYVIAHRVYPG